MRILISGASGLVGSALAPRLRAAGHEVLRLVRREPAAADEVRWDPPRQGFDPDSAGRIDAVVHLAGENVAGGRWTDQRLRRIEDSRLEGTRVLVESALRLDPRPQVWIGASAIGLYGDRGDELLDERSSRGEGFLAELCEKWESASDPVEAAGLRRVLLRIGLVLAADGGALAKMRIPFRLGLGGVIGSGRQWMSWIALDDLCGIIERGLTDPAMHGAYNAVAPPPATNRDFTKALGRVLGRPTLVPLPAFAARLAFGRMADALLLSSSRVCPRRLLDEGFAFAQPELEVALRRVLDRDPARPVKKDT